MKDHSIKLYFLKEKLSFIFICLYENFYDFNIFDSFDWDWQHFVSTNCFIFSTLPSHQTIVVEHYWFVVFFQFIIWDANFIVLKYLIGNWVGFFWFVHFDIEECWLIEEVSYVFSFNRSIAFEGYWHFTLHFVDRNLDWKDWIL